MKAELVVQIGSAIGKRYDLPEGRPIKIGRVGTNEIVILDTQLSRQHSQLINQGGAVLITDLGSRNGTRVNGKRIVQPTRLRNGDAVEVGATRFVLEIDRTPAEDELDPVETGYRTMLQKLDRDTPEDWERLARWCDERHLIDKAAQCRRKAEEARIFNKLTKQRQVMAEMQAKLTEVGLAMCPECRGKGEIDTEHGGCLGTGIDLSKVELPARTAEDEEAIVALPAEVQSHVENVARLGVIGHFVGPRVVLKYPRKYRKIALKVPYLTRIWTDFSTKILERKHVPITEETVTELIKLLARHKVADWERLSTAIKKLRTLTPELLGRIRGTDLDVIKQNAILWSIVRRIEGSLPAEAPDSLRDVSETAEEV